MVQTPELLVFSDLDGTLIDHETYLWDHARPALDALKASGAGLILASSKTAAEIAPIRAEMGFEDWPAIVENGAGLLPAQGLNDLDTSRYEALRAELGKVPAELRRCFTGFGDLSASEVAQVTGLPQDAAALAKTRVFSEPGTWAGSDQDCTLFLEKLGAEGIIGQRGGRFLTLSNGGNKAERVTELTALYTPRVTLALGDAPNDSRMLQSTDRAVIVANPHSPDLPSLDGEAEGRICRTTAPGPIGWNMAVLSVLDELTLQRT